MNKRVAFLLPVLLLIGAGCMSAKEAGPTTAGQDAAVNAPLAAPTPTPSPSPAPAPAPRVATIRLNAVGDFKQSGTVTLTDLPGNQTRIDIALTGTDPDSLPAAIYAGDCKTQDAEVQYPLNPISKGRSTTILDVNITSILDKAPQALKVKRDPVDAKLPFAVCGELK